MVAENFNTCIISLTVYILIIPYKSLSQERTRYLQISTVNVLLCPVITQGFSLLIKTLSLLTDVPYPITHLDFEGGCNSINVTWNPPSPNAEGGRVTGYLAQIKPVSSEEPWFNWTTNDVSQSPRSRVFTHLKPNSEYHVRILAQNKMGYGWPSEVSKVSTIQAGDL